MKKDMKQRLRDKGWSEKEISHAETIMNSAESNPNFKKIKNLDRIVYWVILLIAIVGNFLLSVVLIPVLISFHSFHLYLMMAIMALTFGTVISLLIKEVDDIEKTKFIIAGVFIPAVAVINVILITNFANFLIPVLELNIPEHSPVLMGLFYGIVFVIPQIFSKQVHKFVKMVTNW